MVFAVLGACEECGSKRRLCREPGKQVDEGYHALGLGFESQVRPRALTEHMPHHGIDDGAILRSRAIVDKILPRGVFLEACAEAGKGASSQLAMR